MSAVSDAFLLIGALLVVAGIWFIYWQAGLIAGGGVCIAVALAVHRAAKGRKS